LISKMLELDPLKRISIPDIKRHPCYTLGAPTIDDTLQYNPEPFFLCMEDIQGNKVIIENLKLLGWEESELIVLLLSQGMNLAKTFYQLLYDHRKNSHTTHINNSARANSRPMDPIQRRRSSSIDQQYIYPEVNQQHLKSKYVENMSSNEDDPMDIQLIVQPKESVSNRSHRGSTEHSPEHSRFVIKKESIGSKPKKHRKINRVGSKNVNNSSEPSDNHQATLRVSSRVSRQRAATEGDSIRPEIGVSDGRYYVGWNVSPSKDPHSRIYNFESNRSITQILENLKGCFARFEMELTPDNQVPSNGELIKLKGQGRNHEGEVEVELIATSNGTVASFTRSSNLYQEYFCNIIKELELGSSPEFYVM